MPFRNPNLPAKGAGLYISHCNAVVIIDPFEGFFKA